MENDIQSTQGEEITCSNCGSRVNEDDDFCTHCGSIFSDGIFCHRHRHTEATGVCIVCGVPCCDECGGTVDGIFLCERHSNYEIYEGMVKVYGSHNEDEAELAKSKLEEAGFHPVLFHLRMPRAGGMAEYEVYEDAEEFNSSEIKVMVPCQEVEAAEALLSDGNMSIQKT